ncbi:MAG: hypothetical protein JXR64_10900 [Spirochaetales bacterium]|nr:hypothetical protein [Spirochaetales bacterium]
MNIIIGNNSVILRNMLSEILTEAGNDIICLTSDGEEIIRIAKTCDTDLVILGENLSHASEKDIILSLQKDTHIPIVVMGGSETLGEAVPDKIIPKPQMDKLSDKNYHNELIKELVSTAEKHEKTRKVHQKISKSKIEHIVIGSSTGGPNALKKVLDELPEDFSIPISIVQHMEEGHEEGLATWLNKSCKLKVRMARDKDTPLPGEIIMGEQGKHLSVRNKVFYYTDEDKVEFQKPAVDVLFTTAAKSYKENLLGVLLTGMGRDGAKGCVEILKHGGKTIVQDEATSTVFGMPKAAIELGAASVILPLDKIAEYLISVTQKEIK